MYERDLREKPRLMYQLLLFQEQKVLLFLVLQNQ
jgi:hypothetical protein